MSEQADALDGRARKAEEHHQQSEVPAHHPEQVIEDEYNRYIAGAVEELDREAPGDRAARASKCCAL